MDNIDERALRYVNDEDLLMFGVIRGDHELMYLDTCLTEMLRS